MLTVLTARLLHKGTILQQTAVVLLQKKKRLSLLESIGRIAELFNKKIRAKNRRVRLFYGPGSDRILGNDKGVGVAVFTDRKVTIK